MVVLVFVNEDWLETMLLRSRVYNLEGLYNDTDTDIMILRVTGLGGEVVGIW